MGYDVQIRNRGSSDDEILDDLRRVASKNAGRLTIELYREDGRFHPSTVARRFGTWNKALERAAIPPSWLVNTPDDEWFQNIATVWNVLGRQPSYHDMASEVSEKSPEGYAHRFGSWNAALAAFQQWAEFQDSPSSPEVPGSDRRANQGPRKPSARLRFRVLQRDHFKCQSCGRSPATDENCKLHVDHVLPWSNGGTTDEANLQALCERCNLGKADL